jgi:hypothetical protein
MVLRWVDLGYAGFAEFSTDGVEDGGGEGVR